MANTFYYKQWALATALLIAAVTARGQILSPTVLSSSGAYYSSANSSLSVTIGEMTMVETFTASSIILTQGFQQPEDFNVGIISVAEPGWNITAFPNPASNYVTVQLNGSAASNVSLSLYDIAGKLVSDFGSLQNPAGTTLNLSNLAAGAYVLHFTSSSHSQNIRLVKN